jgi:hypothetical protein
MKFVFVGFPKSILSCKEKVILKKIKMMIYLFYSGICEMKNFFFSFIVISNEHWPKAQFERHLQSREQIKMFTLSEIKLRV